MKINSKLTSIYVIFLFIIVVRAEDWPIWRGPTGNGISTETNWKPSAISKFKTKWRINLGRGYSSVTVVDGKVYTMGVKSKNEVVYCINANDGSIVWQFKYPFARRKTYKGTRATPAVVNGKVYTMSQDGLAHCLDAATGKVVWKKNLLSFGAKKNEWGLAGSPLVHNGMVYYNVGDGGVALNAATGSKKWGGKGMGGYASPILGPKGNVILFGNVTLKAVNPKTGRVVWSTSWETKHKINAADPVVIGDSSIFVASGYNRGCALIDVKGSKVVKRWENKNLCAHISTPVYIKGYVFGFNGNSGSKCKFVCLDPKNGKIKWSKKFTMSTMMVANDTFIILDERGKLYVSPVSTTGLKTTAQVDTKLKKVCWTQPVLSNGVIYCRNDKGLLIAIDVAK